MSNLRSESKTPRPRDAHGDAQADASTDAPLMLSLDTATGVSSVAVTRGTLVLSCARGRGLRENSASVLRDVEAALNAAGVKLADIELFAAATGPGSFTGLRSGLATIKAFASTLRRRVAGIPTLHAVAYAVAPARRVVACLPAGRGEVFAQLLSVEGAKAAVSELSEPFHLSPAALFEKALTWGDDLNWAGAAAHAHAAALCEFAAGRGIAWRNEEARGVDSTTQNKMTWTLAPQVDAYAAQIAALGLRNYLDGATLEAEDLQALYVRLSDAELNEKCRA
ncbi:MAG TPA: tRNA (adenosine(37)-N6)-threonylcarbamoyltransferase complex dimerization subunit type 1 TsaB [Pyrinomonadaceae bacterium]|nr:tRNA (adenosine(37)-N6)-threonylcarbamoyltransferase complex dimerization subunit type 1 TsaB [Pyrinomonadaceae bacterium]